MQFLPSTDWRFVGQSTPWDCGLAAFRSCFRIYHRTAADLSFVGWSRMLKSVGICPNAYGIPLPALAHLGWLLDMKPFVVLGPAYPDTAVTVVRRDPSRAAKQQAIKRRAFSESLAAVRCVRIMMRRFKQQRSVHRQMERQLSSGSVILLETHCSEIYGIQAEDYSHYIVLIRLQGNVAIDPMREWGLQEYSERDWHGALSVADGFEPFSSSGGFIAFRPRRDDLGK